jgi:hypothetical protein
MKKQFFLFLLFFTNLLFSQTLTLENLEKNAGQYYTNIEATLLSNHFEFVNYDNNTKKLTYQFAPQDNQESGNKYCYIWRGEDDKAKIISYFTTSQQEYNNWKKSLMLKDYKSKPIVIENDASKEWFFSKNYGVKILKKQLDSADKSKKITAFILTVIKQKK